MCINEHQLAESSIGEGLCGGTHALFVLHYARCCFSRAQRRRRPMPSDDIQLYSATGARPGIARKVCRAFPAARRQPCRGASALRGQRNIDILTEKSF